MIPDSAKVKDLKESMMPYIVALTALLWGEAVLEITTQGLIHSADNFTEIYLGLLGAYAGVGEAKNWLQKIPADPADDSTLERVQRGGFFVALWFVPLIGAYLWRLKDSAIPMPKDLQHIVMGLVLIFFAKAASRHVRHSRRGVGGQGEVIPEGVQAENTLSVEDRVQSALSTSASGKSFAELQAALPDVPRRSLYRALNTLIKDRRIKRMGHGQYMDAD